MWIEDPSLSFSINSYSDELEISLYGLTQKEIIQTLLEERFSVKVHFDEIKTIYKERPIKKVNKIIQIEVPPNPYWATIGLTIEPLPLGTGLQIESDISYGYLNHSFQNAVFEGIRMSCQSGLHGIRGLKELERRAQSDMCLAFSLFPTTDRKSTRLNSSH